MSEVLRLVGQPVAVRVSLSLLHFLWQGAALAAVAAGLLVALRKASASARYLALVALLAAMAVCPVVTFALVGRAPVAVRPPVLGGVGSSRPSGRDNLRSPQQGRSVLLGRSLPPAPPISEPGRKTGPQPASSRRATWPARAWLWARRALLPALPWISALWVAGVIVLSLRFLMRGWALWRVSRSLQLAGREWQERLGQLSRRLALRRPVELAVSAAARVPMVIRWLRPAIVIPASALIGLTPEQLTALLAHELAHIRRHDQWVNLAQTLIELLLFYHPAVWWVSRAIRAEREHCCGEIAVAVSGDATAYMRALTWVEQHRGATVEPALASSGPPLLGRIRRLAGCPTTLERRNTWLAAILALTVAGAISVAAAVSAATTGSMSGEHQLGVREQWQPQTMAADPRLDKPVHIEILGRAAVPALALLSEQTGVTLQVAPEDTETVGERKFTVIAQGCSLKAIMVQLPKALQECHWDIDLTGKEPVYLLHRNEGIEALAVRLREEENLRRQEESRPAREARLDEARDALAMSPEELNELAKTDPLLAAAMRDPESRKWAEMLMSLPHDQMQEFRASGRVGMKFSEAPEDLQQATRQHVNSELEKAKVGGDSALIDFCKAVLDGLDEPTAEVQYQDWGWNGSGLAASINCERKDGSSYSSNFVVIPPRYPGSFMLRQFKELLVTTGTADGETADKLLAGLAKKHNQEALETRYRKWAREWREPRSPQLHRTVTLPFKGEVEPLEVQRFIAKESGLSLVSDYFTDPWGARPVPGEARKPMPMWRMLYLLGEQWFWTYDWNEAGDCLVLHERYWYSKPPEAPEALVQAWRERLEKQGAFTLDDVAQASVELGKRVKLRAGVRYPDVAVPNDLVRMGLGGYTLLSQYARLYSSLTPEERAQARSAAGLPVAGMTRAQQDMVRQAGARPFGGKPTPEEIRRNQVDDAELSKAIFRVKESRQGPAAAFELKIEFPSRKVGTTVLLPLAMPAASGSQ